MEYILRSFKKIIPEKLFAIFQPAYHCALAFLAAIFYRFPSRDIFVIGITGTKGKTTVTELINAMLENAGHKTALSNSVRFKIGKESHKNALKMTMPGRFFLQRFLREAVNAKCAYAILEMTSEGAKQFRHHFVSQNALVFINLSPEHIESHGSYEKYRDAKLSIAHSLEASRKKRKFIIVNADDTEAGKFLAVNVREKYSYSLKDAEPYELQGEALSFTFENQKISAQLSGLFNLYNILAAALCVKQLGVSKEIIKSAIESFAGVLGRMQYINEGQDFTILVDYAHTPDSLKKVYETFPHASKICVLGAAGGGRDVWKREVMGKIADTFCSQIILTNEDPYDENPLEIVHNIQKGVVSSTSRIIMDRRAAIQEALKSARKGDAVIITGKGNEPYIMGPQGNRAPWNEAEVVREEIRKVQNEKRKTKNSN